MHSCVKPCACDTCGESFIDAGGHKVHERTHTGVRTLILVIPVLDHSHTSAHSNRTKERTQLLNFTNVMHVENHSHGPMHSKCARERIQV